MKSVVINAGGRVTLEDKPVPQIEKSDDVLVEVICSGLCGSDIPRIFHNGAHAYPIILGHEFSGRVKAKGDNATDLNIGDMVACVPLQPCFKCPECQKELWSQCRNYQFIGSRSSGGNSEYIVVPQKNLFRLAEGTTPTEGAFYEPMTVGLHAMQLAGGCKDKEVLIIGAGTIGLLAMQCARAFGARSITVVDINPDRLALARQLGAAHIYNSADMSADDIRQKLESRRFRQLIMETAGTPETIELAITIAGPCAQIALIGTLHNDLHLSSAAFGLILRKELHIMGSWMNYSGMWPGIEWKQATQLFTDGEINLKPLIAVQGGPVPYSNSVLALQGKSMSGKIMLDFSSQYQDDAGN